MADGKLKEFARDAVTRRHVEGIAQAVHVARTGHRVGAIPLDGIFPAWQGIPRKQVELSDIYLKWVQGVFRRFVEFFAARYGASARNSISEQPARSPRPRPAGWSARW